MVDIKVNRLAELTKQQEEIKREIDELKAYFENIASEDLSDSKLKTITYWGDGAKVSVQNSATVKMVSNTVLNDVFGRVYEDFIKEETTYKMTEPCKRLLGTAFMGEYIKADIDDVIKGLGDLELMRKKLKGNFEKDKTFLMNVIGLSEEKASDIAYMIIEVLNYNRLMQVMEGAEYGGSFDSFVNRIKSAIIVDESIKVGVEYIAN